MLNEFIPFQYRVAMHHGSPFGHILHLAIMVERHIVARVQKGLYAQLFNIAERPFDPQHCNMV